MGEELGFVRARKRGNGEDKSGRAWGGDMGSGDFGGGQRKILDGDIDKRNALEDFFKLAVAVLGVLKLWAFYASLLGDVVKNVEEVGQSDGGVGGDSGGDKRRGTILVVTRAVTPFWTRVIPNVAKTCEKVLEVLGGHGEVLLMDDIDL
jgi:hypothetical protein